MDRYQQLSSSEFSLRPAGSSDSETVLSLRNEPSARAQFFDTGPVSPDDHAVWYENFLHREDALLLVMEFRDGRVGGYCRFEINDDLAEVSVCVAPEYRGRGHSLMLITTSSQFMADKFPNVRAIKAMVKPDNVASKKAFIRCGFELREPTTHRGQSSLVLEYEIEPQ